MKICDYDGCDRLPSAKGLCGGHYQQQHKGQPLRPLVRRTRRRGQPLTEFFWERVQKTNSCWIWTGAKTLQGHGCVHHREVSMMAHRLSWEMVNGIIPKGLIVDHLCHTRACVNPDHMRLTDQFGNTQNRSGAAVHSSSGVRGVMWEAKDNLWCAQVTAFRKRHRRRFKEKSDAIAWAEMMRAKLHR